MAQSIREVMTADPRTVEVEDKLVDVARHMREADIGSVIVTENGQVAGIITDRDIVVRALAENKDPSATTVGEVCSRDVSTLTVDQSVDEAIELMRAENVRRVPVVEDGKPAGVVSIGDLAMERDKHSALADISSAPANR